MYHLNVKQTQQKMLQQEELQLEQKQQFWLTRLSELEQQIQVLGNLGALKEDRQKLDELKFFWNSEYDCWASYRYGSA